MSLYQNIIRLMLMVVTYFVTTATLCAQSNPYNLDDTLYKIYESALHHSGTDRAVDLADSMLNVATDRNDLKGQAFALMLKIDHYEYGDSAKFFEACQALETLVEGTEESDHYYYAASLRIARLAREYHFSLAIRAIDEVRRKAEAAKSIYGVSAMYNCLSELYYFQSNFPLSEHYQLENINYLRRFNSRWVDADPYINLADKSIAYRRYEKALEYLDMAEKERVAPERVNSIQAMRCVALFFLGRDREFDRAYALFLTGMKDYQVKHMTMEELPIICRRILDGDYKEAKALLADYEDETLSDRFFLAIEQRQGHWRDAFDMLMEQTGRKDSVVSVMMQTDLNDVTARMGNMTLTMEKAELELHNSRYRIAILLALVVLLLVVMGFVVHNSRQNRRNMEKLQVAYDEAEAARHRAEQSDHAKTEFLQNMTHEIRTPVNAINGFTQLMCMPGVDLSEEEKAEYAGLVQGSSADLTELVDGILAVAELDVDKIKLRMEAVAVNSLLRTAIHKVTPKVQYGVTLAMDSQLIDDVTITTDAARMGELLQCLLTNAAKYTDTGTITVQAAKRADGKLLMAVADTGAGIPKEKAEVIFNRFEKLGSYKPGTGLGLSIARLLATHLGARIWLDTDYASGARFVVEIKC